MENQECRIDSLAQTWSVISEIGQTDRAKILCKSVWAKNLVYRRWFDIDLHRHLIKHLWIQDILKGIYRVYVETVVSIRMQLVGL